MRKVKTTLAVTIAAAAAASAATYSIDISKDGIQLPRKGSHGVEYIAADFDGDGITDIAQVDVHYHRWYVVYSSLGQYSGASAGYTYRFDQLGQGGDYNYFAGDFDGDGRADHAQVKYGVKDGLNYGYWYIKSEKNDSKGVYTYPGNPDAFSNIKWGWGWPGMSKNHTIVVGDYDGDGRDDRVIVEKSSGTWYMISSYTNGFIESKLGETLFGWQWSGQRWYHDIVVGDFDGDGKTDRAIVDRNGGTWYVIPSRTDNPNNYPYFGFKQSGLKYNSVLAVGDYGGDGYSDLAFFNTDNGEIRIHHNYRNGSSNQRIKWPTLAKHTSIQAVPGDYDGDGKTDYAFIDIGTSMLYVRSSKSGTTEDGIHVTRSKDNLKKVIADDVENMVVIENANHSVRADGLQLSIDNLTGFEKVSVVDVRGKQVFSSAGHGSSLRFSLPSVGKYYVRVGSKTNVVNAR